MPPTPSHPPARARFAGALRGRLGRARWLPFTLWLGVAALALSPRAVRADARTDYLVKLLETSQTYRVRAQAAIALGRSVPDAQVIKALVGALRDENGSVRAAAASSLGRVGDASAVAPLEAARRDADPGVRAAAVTALAQLARDGRTRTERPESIVEPSLPGGAARFYVGVGRPGAAVELEDRILEHAHEFIRQRVGELEGVALAPESETPAAARAVLKQRKLSGYYLDSSVVRVENNGAGMRAVVSVIVGTYPGRDMRVILQGAATVQGGGSTESMRVQAIEGALSGALRRLPQALASGEGG